MIDKKVVDFIQSHMAENILFVLKGFSLEEHGYSRSDLATVVSNKIARLLCLARMSEAVISFEEFICLYDFAIAQFSKIYILENSAYYTLYPVDSNLDENTAVALLNHFNNDADENASIDSISDYTAIYGNYTDTEAGIACCYNIDEILLKNEKITRIILSQETIDLKQAYSQSEDIELVSICNNVDYFVLVQNLYNTKNNYSVTWDSYLIGKEIIKKQIEILNAFFPERLVEYVAPVAEKEPKIDPLVKKLMKKYWGYDTFRTLKIYDIDEVDKGNKIVRSISQAAIISDLIEQAENCIYDRPFKDIFVTAPTGAGKSLMFQLPAMYLAEKYNLVTLVITPLIGLMNDQVQILESNGYAGGKTINSDISPIIKQEILDDVAEGKCHILYLSPESLLSRSDIEQLIGSRKIGMIVVDEAHIVTTWGKQFRPDYWYLGDHVQKIRRTQAKRDYDPSPFIIATFTATTIYEGKEDMYHETLNSLHMIDPITYLGYVRRENINIEVDELETKRNKAEYEIDKFNSLIDVINLALVRFQKMLIYFPTVALISRFYEYCYAKDLGEYVTKYHGQMDADKKSENFQLFRDGSKRVMIATKAFGMGIDIPDIAIVSHFAPTGNVCDYMQEIGRAARDVTIDGHAIYKHMSNDFQHINRLHGLSAIQRYQLIEVIKKVLEIYTNTRYKNNGARFTKKRNEMLVDTESFAYIFDSDHNGDNDILNKVKTAMLLIQKDYENRGFAPFYMRPIPLFAFGYFAISPKDQNALNQHYPAAVQLVQHKQNVCNVNLKSIWESGYNQRMSFPKFKFLLYSKSEELDFNSKWNFTSAMAVDVFLDDVYEEKYHSIIGAVKAVVNESVCSGGYISLDEIIAKVAQRSAISRYKAESISNVIIAAMDIYEKDYSRRMKANIYKTRITKTGKVSYSFLNITREFFNWIDNCKKYIIQNIEESKIYVVNDTAGKFCKEITTVLGVLETIGVLRFKSLGGSNSQLYIYVNETKTMQIVRDRPNMYKNKLLDLISSRHTESVKMLTYLFQSKFNSDEIWNHLENYFLGIVPKELCNKEQDEEPLDELSPLLLQIGESLIDDYSSWKEANALFDNSEISKFDSFNIPLADYYAAKLVVGSKVINVDLMWEDGKIAITSGGEVDEVKKIAEQSGWICIPRNQMNAAEFASNFQVN